MTSFKDQRVGIFIDVQNLYHSAKNLYSSRVNFTELIKHLVGNRKLIRSIAYVVKSESALGEGSFFEALKSAGLELRSKDLQVYPGGMKKADWDVGMAVDAIRMAGSLDVVVLVTGDGDFIPLVEYLRWGLGKEVIVAGFSRTAATKLKEATDIFIAVEEIPKILLKSSKARATRVRKPRSRGVGS
jgi:uncharacterized LabA/DUF88 family protein